MPVGILEKNLNEKVTDLPGVEIFRAGDYGDKGEYTPEILDAMASAYSPAVHDAPVTLDHAESGAAYGWIKSLFRRGETLFADLKQVPVSFAAAIKNGRYKKRSAEIIKSFNGGGPYIKAVSFLGVKMPHVQGMADFHLSADGRDIAVAFAGKGEAEKIEFPVARFVDDTTPPDGVAHEVINQQGYSGETLNHDHLIYTDALGNGFSGLPRHWDESRYERVQKSNGHKHVVKDGFIEPADDENGVSHTHSFTTENKFSTDPKSPKEGAIMPEVIETKPDPAIEQLRTEFTAKLEAASQKISTFEAQMKAKDLEIIALKDKNEAARFESVWNSLVESGKAAPAEREGCLRTFMALPADDSGQVITFTASDGKEVKRGYRADFIETLMARPVSIELKKELASNDPRKRASSDGVARFESPTGSMEEEERNGAGPKNEGFDAEVRKFMASNPSETYETAMLKVARNQK